MEIIGRNIPSLQTAIASGLESVASGIQESTQVKGLAAINSAFETFSAPSFGALGAPESLASVADVAQFPEPTQYLQANSSTSANPKFDSREFAAVINDKNFSPLNELSHLGENSLFQRGIIIVGGKVPGDNKLDHLNLPPEPIIPRPEPAQLTAQPSPSYPAVAYGPDLNGSVKPNDGIQAAMEKAKSSYTPKDPEYLYPTPQGITPGGNSPGEVLNEHLGDPKFGEPNPLLVTALQGSADQTETIKNASEKATSDQKASLGGGSIVGLVSKLHWDNLKASELKGSADQTETIKNASQPAGIIKGTADQTETIKGASQPAVKPGGSVSKDLVDQFPPIPSLKDPLLDITVQGSAKQNESVQDAMGKATHTDEKIMNPYHPKGIAGLVSWNRIFQSEFNGSVDQTDTIKNASEKAKPSYTPKDPEYLGSGYAVNKPEGSSASDADQRGIIIVGGKSQGTYFETIDDTLAKMNQNPQPETVQLFQQQVGALQDLFTTVQQSIQMNQQLTSATLMSRFRV